MFQEKKGIQQDEFDRIFANWYDPIRNFIYYKSGNIEIAEDIAQDTFLKIWEKREGIKKETVKSLLYTIANNLYLNKLDHEKVVFKFTNNFQKKMISESPEYELEMKEFDKKLQNALAQLDEKKRSVFLMNRIDELTYNQIADTLGITVKAVEKRMEKALSFLREKINMKF
jgi:RNA polymerase sigma-70 factor (ECF subfamily)